MKTNRLLAFIFLSFLSQLLQAQAPDWVWAKSQGGTGSDVPYCIKTDLSGNVYVGGAFESSSIVFGDTTFTKPANSFVSLFLLKYDAQGNVLWARSAYSRENSEILSMATDAEGNVYAVGSFLTDTIIFDGITLIDTTSFSLHSFMVKYNGQGNLVWAKSLAGVYASSITCNAGNNIFVAGYFNVALRLGAAPISCMGGDDIFVAKYDTSGTVVWARSAGGKGADAASSVSTDAAGNVFVAGTYQSDSIFIASDTLLLFPNHEGGTAFIFLAKYDASGNPLWARSAGSHSDNTFATQGFGDGASGVACDNAGNVYIAGTYNSDTLFFDNIALMNNGSEGLTGSFVAKYSTSGGVIWADGVRGQAYCTGIVTDLQSNIYITGHCLSLDTYFDTAVLYSYGSIYVTKFDSSGSSIWAKGVSGNATGGSVGIDEDASGNSYITGYFVNSPIDFDSIILTNNGSYNIFIAKLSEGPTGVALLSGTSPMTIYPNPTTGDFYLSGAANGDKIEVFDIMGRSVYTATADGDHYPVSLAGNSKGIYFYKVSSENMLLHEGKIVLE